MHIDLNHYGVIGFQREWRRIQREDDNNLLERFIDDCIESNIDGCAVTSEEVEIPRDSHHDRFGILRKIAEGEPTGLSNHRDKLRPDYKPVLLEKNYMQVEKYGRLVHLVNSQAVRLQEEGEKIKVLIIGDNKFEDQRKFSETLEYLKDSPYTIIPKKLSWHKGSAKDEGKVRGIMYENADLYHAVVGFNAQEGINLDLLDAIEGLSKQSVAVSNKHSFSGCGTCIEIPNTRINTSNEDAFLKSLKGTICNGQFTTIEKPERFLSKMSWKARFFYGTLGGRHQDYKA